MSECALCPVYGRPGPAREAEVGAVCRDCLQLLDEDLVLVDRCVPLLGQALAPAGRGPSLTGGHAKPGPRLPVNLGALSLLGPGARTPAGLLGEHATAWAMSRSLGQPGQREYELGADGRPRPPAATVSGLVAWLRVRLHWAAECAGDLATFAREVRQLARNVHQVTGDPVGAWTRPVGWCPQLVDQAVLCLAPLSASTWLDVIECPRCQTRYNRADGAWSVLFTQLRDLGLTRR